jgi:hypothetical protein
MGVEVGIPYEFEGPDGTRVVVNDPSDPDFVGYLVGDGGISGLDGADVRENAADIVEGDGGIHDNFYASRRSVVFSGIISPEPDMEAVNRRVNALLRATNALREDGIVRWQETGEDFLRRLTWRRQQKPAITGRRPKAFQIALVSADYRIFSDEEHSLSVLGTAGEENGVGFNLAFDLSFGGGGVVGQLLVENAGDAETPPRLKVSGPVTNPIISNVTTGEEIRLLYTLAEGEYLEIDTRPDDVSVLLNGATDRYSALDFVNSDIWQLAPGVNDIRLQASSIAAPATLVVNWRDAWP